MYAVGNEGLIIPKPEEMQGKGEQIPSGKSGIQSLIRLGSLGFLAMAVGAVLFWVFGLRNVGQGQLLDEDIRDAKVAVAIFENFTGDQNLDAIGYLASEWITSSLREIDIKTVAPEMMRQYKDYVGILPNNPEGKTSLAEITQARYLISGSYFDHNDSIRLNMRLLDAISGEEVQTFPVFWKKKEEKNALIEEARQKLMGYWAIEQNHHFPKVDPPSYQAYQRFLACTPGQTECYVDVLSKDSTFILAHVSLMSLAAWGDFDSLFHASKSFIERNWDRCTQYEKNYFQQADAFWKGDYEASYRYYNANYQLDTMNLIMLHQSATVASMYLNKPDIAVKRLGRVFADYKTYRDNLWNNNFYHYADALNRTEKSSELIQLVESLPVGDWRNKGPGWVWLELYIAYLNTGQYNEAIAYVDTMLQWSPNGGRRFLISKAAYIWSTFHQDTLPNPFHRQIRERLNEYMKAEKAGAWTLWGIYNSGSGVAFRIREYQAYLLQDWEEAEREFLSLKASPPTFMKPGEEMMQKLIIGVPEVWIEGMLGSIYARRKKDDLAIKQLEKLDLIAESFPQKHAPILRGIIPYHQARIHALLGNKKEAVAYLRKSLDAGKPIFFGSFRIDYDLSSLRGYEPYEELIRP